MLELLKDLPEGIEGLSATGTVSKQDYEQVLEPLLERARREDRRIRFLYHFGPKFERFTARGAWEDARIGLGFIRFFDACAIVSDVRWIRESSKLADFLMPCPVRVFGNDQWNEAVEWLGAFPDHVGVAHRLLADRGILVVEVKGALRTQDFDDLAITADSWIRSHGELRGLVIHAREFPGWENVGSFFRHIRFVQDHHKKVRRIALAADSKVATLAPRVSEHFVQAEVKHFGYDDLEEAIGWAAGGGKAGV